MGKTKGTNLPEALNELKDLMRWVCVESKPQQPSDKSEAWEGSKNKKTKTLWDPYKEGKEASTDNPNTWASFDAAIDIRKEKNYDSVNFVLGDGYTVIGLKKSVDRQGRVADWAQVIVDELDAYTEYTPARKGLRVIVRVDKNRVGKIYKTNSDGNITVCNGGDTAAFTGDVYGTEKYVNDRTDQVIGILTRHFQEWKEVTAGEDEADADEAEAGTAAEENATPAEEAEKPETEKDVPGEKHISLFSNISRYISSGAMDRDITEFSGNSLRKTGFACLDGAIGGLYPGLYALGATSGLGKTTFMYQVADQLAEAGEHVIYFSLEQTELEMVTKGISRRTAQIQFRNTGDYKGAVMAINIRNGKYKESKKEEALVRQAMEEYAVGAGKNLTVIECEFDSTCKIIEDCVKEYIRTHPGLKPVVIVDYLQILQSDEQNVKTTKDTVDSNIRLLKSLQRDNSLVVFVICSINRSSYDKPVEFSAFKETGSIEFSCDAVWGLQLSILDDPEFLACNVNTGNKSKEKATNDAKKADMIKKAKKAKPRKVKLVSLKNRNGDAVFENEFKYYSAYDLFVPMDGFEKADDVIDNIVDDDEEREELLRFIENDE
ncbi:MAG: hypothetical protein LUG27_05415 [Clostridiales bacterium]|nr:hypothetical protein [Clostridiales bacterium]